MRRVELALIRMPVTPFSTAPTEIPGLLVVTMKQIEDERGVVRELYRASSLAEAGTGQLGPWVQINATETRQGAIRGLHGEEMTKLVAVVHGEAFGAFLDARPGSPAHGCVVTQRLSPGTQVLVPPGVCNGFQSLTPGATQYVYCFDREWQPDLPGRAFHPLDPGLAIAWPIPIDPRDPAMLSVKDAAQPLFER